MGKKIGISKRTFSLIVLAIIVPSYVLMIYSHFAEEGDKRARITETPAAHEGGDYLEIDVGIISIDLQKENLELRLDFIPHGRLAKPDGSLSRPIRLHTTGVNGEVLQFTEGERMASRDVAFDLHGGEVSDYPFDKHTSVIEFAADENVGHSPDAEHVPTEVDFYSFHHGLDLKLTPFAGHDTGYVGYEAVIQRSRLVIGAAIFCMLVMWGLAFSSLLVLWSALSHTRELDTGALALLSGLIIAIYFFRGGLPDTPATIGTFSDYLAFFWAEAIVSVVTIIYTWKWFQRGKD